VERLRFIEHKGRKLLYMDCSSNNKDEAYAIFEQFDVLIRKEPERSVLVLCNFENCYHDSVILGKWKRASTEHERHVSRTACVKVEGLFKIAMAAYRFFARLRGIEVEGIMRNFGDEEAAKDWLVDAGHEL
jgi:hypothetical protein